MEEIAVAKPEAWVITRTANNANRRYMNISRNVLLMSCSYKSFLKSICTTIAITTAAATVGQLIAERFMV
jgi:hypothetical protein